LKLEEIRKLCRGKDHLHVEDKFAIIVDLDFRCKRAFSLNEEGEYTEINVKDMIKQIAKYLSKHVNLEALLQDRLLHEPTETILDLNERIKKEPEVKERRGCYTLLIKGKQGKPTELQLV